MPSSFEDLLNLEVKKIMSSPVISVDKGVKVEDAVRVMFDNDIESLVVVHQNRVVGIMTFRDIASKVVLERKDASEVVVEQVMSSELTTCKPTSKIIDVIKLMRKKRLRRMPVIDSDGSPVGFVSAFDLTFLGPIGKEPVTEFAESFGPTHDIAAILDDIIRTPQVVLMLAPAREIPALLLELLKGITFRGFSGVMVSVTRTYDILTKEFESRKIDSKKVFVIDAITTAALRRAQTNEPDNCLYVNSPSALNDMSIFLDKALDKWQEARFLVFDSLATFLIFNQFETTVKFFSFVFSKARKRGLVSISFALSSGETKLADHIAPFCDRVVELRVTDATSIDR